MGTELTPELQLAIQRLISDLLLKYGVIAVLSILVVLAIGWYWFRNKLEGEVQKGVDKHKAEIDSSYTRQLTHYKHYVAKQHEAYAKLNELLLKAEGMAVFQRLRSYPDFKQYSEPEITEYLQARMVTDCELKHMLSLIPHPKDLQDEMQNYTERYNIHKARDLFNDTKNHYWMNALYFSTAVSDQLDAITDILHKMILTRENPANGDRLSKEDMQQLADLQKELRSKIDEIVMQMKSELSAGLAS